MSKIPVLVLAFNRPDHVEKAMQAIQAYQPDRLYLECDGARPAKQGEAEAVEATRKKMLEMVNWECEVKTLFRDTNWGCAEGVNDAITWFFNQEEYGIICEDDIVLSPDFFTLCEDLLPRYAEEERIMQITARNTSKRTDINNTYVYSQTFHCWGWASWRRAWNKMDMKMEAVDRLSAMYLVKRLGLFRGIMMLYKFRQGRKHLSTFSSWATRWYLSILDNDALVLCPGVNLARNIGMDGGTHFDEYDKKRKNRNVGVGGVEWPLKYNDVFSPEEKQKKYDSEVFFRNRMFGLKKKILKATRIIKV